jgi:hypothetical protein
MRAHRHGAAALTLLAGLAGCRSGTGDACQQDSDCGAGAACSEKACVPRISGDQTAWTVELLPKSETAFARTEAFPVMFSSEAVTLKVEHEQMVSGSILDLDTSTLPMAPAATVRVLLSFPTDVGRDDRQREVEAASKTATGPVEFKIGVPESAIGQPATLRMVPLGGVERILPVWSVSLGTLGPMVILSVPKSNDLNTVEGILQSALGATEPITDYAVRALVGGTLVSNVGVTTAQGRFALHIPKAINPDAVTVELTPQDATSARPIMVTKVSAAKLNLGVLRLPPYSKPQPIDVPVTAMGTTKKLSGVTLRFSTVLPGAVGADATATFRREFQTDKDGVAHVQVLPGNTGETRSYAVAAIPPPNSEFAARCFPSYAVAAASGQARVGASLELLPKLGLSGQVVDADGLPLNGVIITVIRKDSTFSRECGTDVASTPPTVTTDADGSYHMMVEPGTYRLEYEPAMGTNSPLLVEDELVISQNIQRTVTLPPGALAEGIVRTPEDVPAAGCEVRVFAPGRIGAPMELRGRTRTAVDGRFRIILPRMSF